MNDKMKEIYAAASACTKCPLHKTKKSCVFGCGNENADLMFVGEAPGEAEDNAGVPFVGAAGQLLDRYLYAVDVKREDVYIANILKCRPPKNRDPQPDEQDACIAFLRAQVKIIRPKIIVCLGRIAGMKLISPDLKITRDHGKWTERAGVYMTAVYHPAALLRDSSRKGEMLDDMKAIAEKLRELTRD